MTMAKALFGLWINLNTQQNAPIFLLKTGWFGRK